MAVRRTARVLLHLAWVNSSLLSYGCTLYGVSIIAFGLGYLIFAMVWLYVVRRKYYCLWPGSIHLCYHMAICDMAQVLLPLAWVTSSLPSMTVRRMARVSLFLALVSSPLLSYACTPYGASIIAFGLGYLIFAIVWLYVVWRKYYCHWPG